MVPETRWCQFYNKVNLRGIFAGEELRTRGAARTPQIADKIAQTSQNRTIFRVRSCKQPNKN